MKFGAVVTGLLLLLLALFQTPVPVNIWGRMIDPHYVIPAQSSVATFQPAVMNHGSGDWWIYGEDQRFYYHYTGDDARPVIAIDKSAAAKCRMFNPVDVSTWC